LFPWSTILLSISTIFTKSVDRIQSLTFKNDFQSPQHLSALFPTVSTANMPIPSYGAMPLSKMFLLVRILQALAMVIVIGITSNFVQMIVTTGVEPPKEFVGTLSVVCHLPFDTTPDNH
jgi:hypothetical protein